MFYNFQNINFYSCSLVNLFLWTFSKVSGRPCVFVCWGYRFYRFLWFSIGFWKCSESLVFLSQFIHINCPQQLRNYIIYAILYYMIRSIQCFVGRCLSFCPFFCQSSLSFDLWLLVTPLASSSTSYSRKTSCKLNSTPTYYWIRVCSTIFYRYQHI